MRINSLLSLFVGILLGTLSACGPEVPIFEAKDVSKVDYAQGFSLPDFDGNMKTLANFKGKVVVIFFGYTQCPDICPNSLSELVQIKSYLGADADKLQGVFVTVDPERDQAQMLKAYVKNFDPTFIALVPNKDQLKIVTKEYKIIYKKIPGQTATSYTIDHSTGSYIYDQTGKLRLYSRYGLGAEKLSHDIKKLINVINQKSSY